MDGYYILSFLTFVSIWLEVKLSSHITKCPLYTCNGNSTGPCMSSVFGDGRNNVTLNPLACNGYKNQKCWLGFEPYFYYSTYYSTINDPPCKELNYQRDTFQGYPGEDCDDTHKCLNGQLCVNSTCAGSKENDSCKDSKECLVGLFCTHEADESQRKCKKQRLENEDCENAYDCMNKLTCVLGKCKSAYYKYANGEKVSNSTGYELSYACQSGGTFDGVCDDMILKEKGSSDHGGFTPCELFSKCHYANSKGEVLPGMVNDCECGYNDKGLAFCPMGTNYRSKERIKAYQDLSTTFDNTCHTLNRFTCYKADVKKVFKSMEMFNGFEKDHLYQGAVDCAKTVIASNFLCTSIITLVIGIMIFID